MNQKDCVTSRRATSTGKLKRWGSERFRQAETSSVLSETNLKIKQASTSTVGLTSPPAVSSFAGQIRSEQPNNSLYTFEATLSINTGVPGGNKEIPLGPDQMLLRGSQLRNTAWMYGLVIFTGHETKLMRNAT